VDVGKDKKKNCEERYGSTKDDDEKDDGDDTGEEDEDDRTPGETSLITLQIHNITHKTHSNLQNILYKSIKFMFQFQICFACRSSTGLRLRSLLNSFCTY
jgi:hypothetical protein